MHDRKNWRVRLDHIREAILQAQEFAEGYTKESFCSDLRTVYAVFHCFIVIGEASRHVPKEIQAQYRYVPWADMIAMRHVIVHDYHRVDSDRVWNTLKCNLPVALAAVDQMIIETAED